MKTFSKLYDELFESVKFEGISIFAKVIYSRMLSRVNLSKINNWIDESGEVYIIFSVKEVMKTLGCGNQKAVKVLKELESIGFIKKKRQGGGKVNLIYVKDVFEESVSEIKVTKEENKPGEVFFINDLGSNVEKNNIANEKLEDERRAINKVSYVKCENHTSRKKDQVYLKCENHISTENLAIYDNINTKDEALECGNHILRSVKITPNEVLKSHLSNINNNIYNNNIYPINQSSIIYNNTKEFQNGLMDKHSHFEKLFKQNICYEDCLKKYDADDIKLIDDILKTMVDVASTSKKTIRVNCEDKPVEVVRSIFEKITSENIDYILESINGFSGKIKNIRAYLITTIYNSYMTYNSYLVSKNNYERKNKLNLPEQEHKYNWDEINRRNLEELEKRLEEDKRESKKLEKNIDEIKPKQVNWEEEYLRELEEKFKKIV